MRSGSSGVPLFSTQVRTAVLAAARHAAVMTLAWKSARRPGTCCLPELASPGVAPPVVPGGEFLESAETLSSHPGTGAGVFKRNAKVGGDVGCLANLALCPEGLR